MKTLCFFFLLFITVPLAAQQVSEDTKTKQSELLKNEPVLLLKNEIENSSTSTQVAKPNLVTAQDKILWNRPVSKNPNYMKVMPLKDPNEVVKEDNE